MPQSERSFPGLCPLPHAPRAVASAGCAEACLIAVVHLKVPSEVNLKRHAFRHTCAGILMSVFGLLGAGSHGVERKGHLSGPCPMRPAAWLGGAFLFQPKAL